MTKVLPLLPLLLLVACGGEEREDPEAWRWRIQVALEQPDKLGGCDVGDLDPDRPGLEIAAVSGPGKVFLVYREGTGWAHETLAETEGEMIQCAVGDADPERDGNELVVVGMAAEDESSGGPGAAYVVFRDGEAWQKELVFEDAALVHGVCIGEVDAEHPGNEVVTVGFSERATVLGRVGGAWAVLARVALPSAGKSAVVFDGGVAVACLGGTVTHVKKGAEGWSAEALDAARSGQARIATDGRRLLVAGDDGALVLLEGGRRTVIHRESQKLRGAVLADVAPASAGLEAATAGYGMTLTVLYPTGATWDPMVVMQDTARFHHLAAGDLFPEQPGVDLVACGYSGRLLVVSRVPR